MHTPAAREDHSVITFLFDFRGRFWNNKEDVISSPERTKFTHFRQTYEEIQALFQKNGILPIVRSKNLTNSFLFGVNQNVHQMIDKKNFPIKEAFLPICNKTNDLSPKSTPLFPE